MVRRSRWCLTVFLWNSNNNITVPVPLAAETTPLNRKALLFFTNQSNTKGTRENKTAEPKVITVG